MEKLFLLDAYALIYRAYYAFIKNPRINSKGLNTSAILGFVNTLEEVLTKEQPSHIGIAFDPSGPTFRHEAYEQYKAQREETPEGIRTAVPYIKDIIRAYRIPILEIPGYEADDVIGTLARQADARGVDTFMMTPDKDYGQLVTDHVKMYRPKYGDKEFEVLGVEEVKEKYGLTSPTQVIDMLGLMGDSADNIPGCPGVGEKTATKLIQQFGSIENLLAGTDQLKGALKTKIENNKEQIEFSKFLATIKTDVPIELDMEQLKKEEPDEEKLRSLFEELEFRTLLDRKFKKENPQPAQDLFQGTLFADFTADSPEDSKNSSLTKYNKADFDYQLIDTEEKRKKIIDLFLTNDFLSLDTETTGTDPISAKLVGLSFSIRENQAFYVPIPQNDEEAQKIVNEFKPIYENENILKIGQNIKYDLLVLQNYGVELKGKIFDTMIAHYLLQPELHHGMDYMAEVYLNYQTIHIEELIGKGKNQKNMADLPPTAVYEYACEDADVTLKLKNILEPQLKENDCDRLFWEIEMPLMPVLAYMERNGVCIDREGLKETSRLYTEEMNRIEQEIHELAGTDFNIASPKQVGEVLFDRLKIVDKPKKTKTGQYVTSEEVLESLRTKHPVVEKILEHRGLKKLLGTYIDALPKLVNPETGHIHTSFNQTITTTGRLSSSNPNLQNIPVRNEYGKEIRKAFIPEEGCLFFSADYSQIELRIMAHLSGDEHMIEAFRNGYDIHAATAAKIFKKSLEEVTKEERSKAKAANFGIIYGITAFGLAERMGVSRTEAKELIEGYFQTYPKVKEYMNRSIEMAREKGYTETVYHRKCHLRDINSHNAVVRGYAERNAINSPIQGSAADIIKIAMIRIYHRFREEQLRSKMILQVHDELNFSVYPEEEEKVQQIVIEEMEHAYSMQVPLEADYGWGKNWLEAH
ncbi:MAG: DNA polymerase I [Candidatus Paraprevotella stercoravium]|uniref:DNA polymerase I n=1 Tax=Candidatus Paraprevotella stercoravium TaxID=2838725 RepID=A0A9E2P0H4_9BACT|nr:DNA polymerase I [Candidatus Paraprevotella stercoravium]